MGSGEWMPGMSGVEKWSDGTPLHAIIMSKNTDKTARMLSILGMC
jgi:hypothetical protein